MGQEFIIKSQNLEDKVNQLLPSQGGFQAGVDLSASTTIIPIVDLTESAEGSSVNPDLQQAFSHNRITHNTVANTTTTIINTTGYFRVFGEYTIFDTGNASINITDGATSKIISRIFGNSGYDNNFGFDFIVFLAAGDSVTATSSTTTITVEVTTMQIADINGNLTVVT